MEQQSRKPSATRRMLYAVAVAATVVGVGLTVNPTRPSVVDTIQTVPAGPYVAAAIRPTASQADADRAVRDYYAAWKAAFLRDDCGVGTLQVYSPDAAYPYVAEGQAYGLVITVSMTDDGNAQALFDGILRFVLAHPSVNNRDLMAAEQDADCSDAGGANSATDGDLDIAYALILADKRWGSSGKVPYRSLAVKRIAAIKRSLVNPTSNLMLLGDWSKPGDPTLYATSRTSDWLLEHFRAFRRITGDSDWDRIREAHQRAIATLQARYGKTTGLLPDFVQATETGVEPVDGKVLESEHDGDYHFNACRLPWRIGLDAVTSGDAMSLDAARKLNAWATTVTDGEPDRFGSGYTLAGKRYGDGNSNAFWTPLAVAAMTDPGSQAWLDALWAKMAASRVDPENYYGTTIQLQVMIIVSGNYTPA